MTLRERSLKSIIAQHRAAGLMPCEIHMNAATRDEFVRETGITPKSKPDTRSTLDRALGRGTPPETVLAFEDVPLVTNEALQSPMIILRPAQLQHDPDWLQHVRLVSKDAQQPRMPAEGTPWHQPVAEAPEGAVEEGDTSPDALSRGGGVNPTTVLLKAMDGLDKIEDIVVLRFYKDRSIDLCSTMNRYGVVGGLQAAIGYVMNGEID